MERSKSSFKKVQRFVFHFPLKVEAEGKKYKVVRYERLEFRFSSSEDRKIDLKSMAENESCRDRRCGRLKGGKDKAGEKIKN